MRDSHAQELEGFQGNNGYSLKEAASIAILCSVVIFALSQISDAVDEGAPLQFMLPFLALLAVLIVMIPLSFKQKPVAFLISSTVYIIADIGTIVTPGTPWVGGWRSLFNLTYLLYYGISTYAIYINIGIYKVLSKRS